MTTPSVDAIVGFFESLKREDVQRMSEFYRDDAFFKDPFNEVRGIAAIQRIFTHMFETLDDPHFVITERTTQGSQCWLAWEFRFGMRSMLRGQPQVVRGASHLQLADDGRIQSHRDYWTPPRNCTKSFP